MPHASLWRVNSCVDYICKAHIEFSIMTLGGKCYWSMNPRLRKETCLRLQQVRGSNITLVCLPSKWSDKVHNTALWEWTIKKIKNRIRRWIGRMLRKPPKTITRQTITRTPQGRGEEEGHEPPGKEKQKKKQRRWDAPGKDGHKHILP